MARILLVEDDPTVSAAVAAHLARVGHEVTPVLDGALAVEQYAALAAAGAPPDLVLLDLMLPGLGGFEVSRRVRTMRPEQPVIMVTARGQEHERVQGLQHGADDYVTKPFSLRELDLRIRSVLRRAGATPDRARIEGSAVDVVLRDGDLVLDLAARTLTRSAVPLGLTAREFDLLAWLVAHPGTVWSREDLLREVWGWDIGDQSTVTVHARRLRAKVEDDPSAPERLLTVFGRGYRWASRPAEDGAHVAPDGGARGA